METIRLALRRLLIGAFVLMMVFFVLALIWLLCVALDIIPHGQ